MVLNKTTKLGRVINLGSSSDGNAFLIEILRKGYPNPFRLLIECGFDYKKLSTRLLKKGIGINDLNAILVTHEHLDHCRALPNLFTRGKKIYAPLSVFEKFGLEDKVETKYIIKEKVQKRIADGIKVLGFPLDHENEDGSNIYNLGYIITVDDDFKILFVTDTRHIRWDLSKQKFNVIFIEANNEYRVMTHALKNAKENNEHFKANHLNRVLRSHMLVEKTAKTLSNYDLSKTETVFLIHVSANKKISKSKFKKIVINKLQKFGKIRTLKITKNGEVTYMKKPQILVATENGDWE